MDSSTSTPPPSRFSVFFGGGASSPAKSEDGRAGPPGVGTPGGASHDDEYRVGGGDSSDYGSPTGASVGDEDECGILASLTPHVGTLKLGKHERTSAGGGYRDDDDDDDNEGAATGPYAEAANKKKTAAFHATPVAIKTLKRKEEEEDEKGRREDDDAPPGPKGVVVLWSPACFLHDTGATHQECIQRLEVLVGLEGAFLRQEEVFLREATLRAPLADILRVHDFDYVAFMKKRCEAAPAAFEELKAAYFDSDTRLCAASFEAAVAAAGAAIEAVDLVTLKNAPSRAAFVATRPPGHHAGPRGAVAAPEFWKNPNNCSCGFCLLNNAAIAAAYARYRYSRAGGADDAHVRVRRVAIVDFDIHHGNGTEAIVRLLRPTTVQQPLPPSWPPQSYKAHKPWLDDSDGDDVFFASIHIFGNQFYPADGDPQQQQQQQQKGAAFADLNIINVALSPVGPAPGDYVKRNALNEAKRRAHCDQASSELRTKVLLELVPKLRAFQPDLLILSAGFDGHERDLYHFFTNDDYEWLTTTLQQAAAPTSGGRCVSVLEGGYAVQPIPTKHPTQHRSRTRLATANATGGGGGAAPGQQAAAAAAAAAPEAKTSSITAKPQPKFEDCGLVQAARAHVRALAAFECPPPLRKT